MRVPLARPPDLLTPWRSRLLAHLSAHNLGGVVVGPRRPADIENLQGSFVRIMNLGGPITDRALWRPRLTAESWAPTVEEAQRLGAHVAQATARLVGYRQEPTQEEPGMVIDYCVLDLAGSDQSINGKPFVLTTTSPMLVSILQLV